MDMQKLKQLKDGILKFVAENGKVTYAELSKNIDGFNGKYEYRANNKWPNVVLWVGMSKEAVIAIKELVVREKILTPVPALIWDYLYTGQALHLPIAKRPPRTGYKKPHWLPTMLIRTPKHLLDT